MTVTNDEVPTVLSASVNAGTKVLTITLSEALSITNAAVFNDFTVLADNVSNSVTGAALSNNNTVLTLTLTDYVLNGQSVSIAYTSNGYVEDSFSQKLQSFSKASTVVDDNVSPSIVGVSSTKAAGSYKVGEQIDIAVEFSEDVLVTGSPRLTLETGSIDTKATYASGSGSDTLTFSYTVVSGDTASDLDYASTAAVTLSGGTIKDPAGNTASTTLASPGAAGSLGASEALVIDTTPPSVAVSDISYNSSSLTVTITGTGFSDIASFDWAKFKLDINNDGSTTTDHTFSDSDISSTTITDTEIKAVLVDGTGTAYGHDEITNLTGFGATDGAGTPSMAKDNFEI
ncbi:MAG: SwmB domain-containing protein, partial [Pseudomonadales bacterium]